MPLPGINDTAMYLRGNNSTFDKYGPAFLHSLSLEVGRRGSGGGLHADLGCVLKTEPSAGCYLRRNNSTFDKGTAGKRAATYLRGKNSTFEKGTAGKRAATYLRGNNSTFGKGPAVPLIPGRGITWARCFWSYRVMFFQISDVFSHPTPRPTPPPHSYRQMPGVWYYV